MAAGLRYGVEVRRAAAADAPELSRLLPPLTPAAAAERLDAMRDRADGAILVATGYGGLSGIVALHWAAVLQLPRPVAMVTALVVDVEERRHGIGRLLLKAASQAARAAGCDTMDVAAAEGSLAAFCRATGFVDAEPMLRRSLRRRSGEA